MFGLIELERFWRFGLSSVFPSGETVQELGDATSVALQDADNAAFLRQRLKSLLLKGGCSCTVSKAKMRNNEE